MPANGFFRGYKIVFINDKWLYQDNMKPIPGYGGELRPCKKCNSVHGFHESDKCLGNLPGVDNACCGHGVRKESYIRFTNGIVVNGFEIQQKKS
jgi:hypothetical protein